MTSITQYVKCHSFLIPYIDLPQACKSIISGIHYIQAGWRYYRAGPAVLYLMKLQDIQTTTPRPQNSHAALTQDYTFKVLAQQHAHIR